MKNWLIILLMTLVGSSAIASDFEVEVDEWFDSFKASGKFKVILKQGDVNTVQVSNPDEDDLDDERIIIAVKDEELRIHIKSDTYGDRKMQIVVTYTDVTNVTAKLGAQITVKSEMNGDIVELVAESGGKIKANVSTLNVMAEISAGGSIHIEGKCAEAEYKVNMGGTIGAVSLAAGKITAAVTAGGEVICGETKDLNIKITSGGNVSYMGTPEAYKQKITLGGNITKMANSNKK